MSKKSFIRLFAAPSVTRACVFSAIVAVDPGVDAASRSPLLCS
jgi:hypothetical protein